MATIAMMPILLGVSHFFHAGQQLTRLVMDDDIEAEAGANNERTPLLYVRRGQSGPEDCSLLCLRHPVPFLVAWLGWCVAVGLCVWWFVWHVDHAHRIDVQASEVVQNFTLVKRTGGSRGDVVTQARVKGHELYAKMLEPLKAGDTVKPSTWTS